MRKINRYSKNRIKFFLIVLFIGLTSCGGGSGNEEPILLSSDSSQPSPTQPIQAPSEICLSKFAFTNAPDYFYGGADAYVEENVAISLNDNGIVLIDYGTAHDAGKQITPMTIWDYSTRAYVDYCDTKDSRYKSILIEHAQYLIENTSNMRSYASWDYDFAIEKYDLAVGWTSSIGNAAAMLVLLEAYSIDRDERYLSTIESALDGFKRHINLGGLALEANGGGTWFEEYPNPKDPSTVLNGHLFAVLALAHISESLFVIDELSTYDLRLSINDLVNQGIEAVVNNAYIFDNEERQTTFYSIQGARDKVYALPYAYWGYMHVYGILWIANRIGSEELQDLGEKWQGYIDAFMGSG